MMNANRDVQNSRFTVMQFPPVAAASIPEPAQHRKLDQEPSRRQPHISSAVPISAHNQPGPSGDATAARTV